MNKKQLLNVTKVSSQGKYVDHFSVLDDMYHFNILKTYYFNILRVVSGEGVVIKILTINSKVCVLLTTNMVQILTSQPYGWYKVLDTPCCAKSFSLIDWSWIHARYIGGKASVNTEKSARLQTAKTRSNLYWWPSKGQRERRHAVD